MPVSPTYPGVYIEELSSGVRTISGVATSITAFVGYTARGLDNRAKRIFSFADFERHFGGLAADSELSYAASHYFANGGSEAYVVRVPKNDAKAALITAEDSAGAGAKKALTFTALSKGAWANQVVVDVDYDGIPVADTKAFNLTITDRTTGVTETFANVTMDTAKSSFVEAVVNDPDTGSQLVSVKVADATAGRPVQTGLAGGDIDLAALKNDNDYGLRLTLDVPETAPNTPVVSQLPVVVIAKGDAIPGSILGLAKLVERTVNLALGAKLPGASVRVTPSASGKGLRLMADAGPGRPVDPTITVTTAVANDLAATLKLDGASNPSKNVSHYNLGKGRAADAQIDAVAGEDGTVLPKSADLIGSQAQFTGIYALLKVDLFNILCIPDATRALASNPKALDSGNVDPNSIYSAAMTLCKERRAFLLVDAPPNVNTVDSAVDWKSSGLKVHDTNGAAYFPRLRMPDPLNDFQLRTFAPSGVVAGLLARTDATRGVWKAPAGVDARLTGVQGLVYELNDQENGALNPLGLNCFRTFPVYGTVCWGARTLTGADAEGSEWKYVPVRRLALFLEETLYRGSKWVVFEPNDESLWAQIRLNITAFMQSLFRQGAFAGASPREAYLVKCDKETTTQDDINRGIVNILVGFAPLKPAEFVIIKIQQLAGQVQA